MDGIYFNISILPWWQSKKGRLLQNISYIICYLILFTNNRSQNILYVKVLDINNIIDIVQHKLYWAELVHSKIRRENQEKLFFLLNPSFKNLHPCFYLIYQIGLPDDKCVMMLNASKNQVQCVLVKKIILWLSFVTLCNK